MTKTNVLTTSHNNIEGTMNDQWLNPKKHQNRIRLAFIKSFNIPLPTICPECGNILLTSQDEDETLCSHCGLVTSASIEYVAGQKIDLPYGRH